MFSFLTVAETNADINLKSVFVFFCLHSNETFDQEVKVSLGWSAQQTLKFVLPIVECKVARRRQTQTVCGVINHLDRGEGSRRESSTHWVSLLHTTSLLAPAKENCNCALIPLSKFFKEKKKRWKAFFVPFSQTCSRCFCSYVKQRHHCYFQSSVLFYYNFKLNKKEITNG